MPHLPVFVAVAPCAQCSTLCMLSARLAVQHMITDGSLLGSSKSLDDVVAINTKLMTALRAVVADRDHQLEQRLRQTEAEIRPQLEVCLHATPQAVTCTCCRLDQHACHPCSDCSDCVTSLRRRNGACCIHSWPTTSTGAARTPFFTALHTVGFMLPGEHATDAACARNMSGGRFTLRASIGDWSLETKICGSWVLLGVCNCKCRCECTSVSVERNKTKNTNNQPKQLSVGTTHRRVSPLVRLARTDWTRHVSVRALRRGT